LSAAISPSSPRRTAWDVAADLFDPPAGTLDDLHVAQECQRSLSRLIREAWPIIEPATPLVSSWHIDVIAEHLEAVTAGELPRLIINVPPRTMKSIETGVLWPAWEWLSAGHIRWLFASYAASLAQRDSLKMRRLIRSQGGKQTGTIFERLGYQGVLRLLTDPADEPWALTKDQDAKNRYDTTATGFRVATSVGAMATGEGGDRIVVDDPLNAEQARSDTERAAANVWWDETMTTRFNNAQAAAVIVMQRLHEKDLTGHLLEKGGWHHLCLPAEYEPAHPFVYPDRVKLPGGRELPGDPRTDPGQLLDPIRLPQDRLAELARDLGSYAYAGQMQQRPSPLEGGMFRRHWWRRYDDRHLDQLHGGFDRVIASWDMRFSDHDKATTSYVVGQVWATHGADRYLLGQVRARLSFTDTLKAVRALDAWKPEAVAKLVERKANGAAVIDTLRHKIAGLIAIEPEGGKDVRAAAVEPYVEAGNVYLPVGEYIPCPPSVPADRDGPGLTFEPTRVSEFIEEHAVFPNGSHDDQVDAMTQALNWLRTGIGQVITEPAAAAPQTHPDLTPAVSISW
jgi:predicted phage terminase large subunit-like protein